MAITAPKHFSDIPTSTYNCPKCTTGILQPDQNTFVKTEPAYSKNYHDHDAWEPEWIVYRFSLNYVCNKQDCGEVAIVSGAGSVCENRMYLGYPDQYESYFEKEHSEEFWIKSFFPAPRLCYIPPKTPHDVADHLNISFAVYWVEVSAAANALRASLEALLDQLGVPAEVENATGKLHRLSLHRRLEMWSDTNSEYANLCITLKEVGNLGSHGETVKDELYFSSLEIYSHVLTELFENPAKKMKLLAESIRNDLKGKRAEP